MIKVTNKNKNLIISHISDVDGVSCVILSILAFSDIDYILCEPSELPEVLNDIIIDEEYKNYNKIFLTDLSICKEAAVIINKKKDLKSKFMHFDHHVVNEDVLSFDFINSIIESNNVKTCATSVFYNYLVNDLNLKKLNIRFICDYIELVRSLDTWDWKENNNLIAKYLSNIFFILGPQSFIEKFVVELSDFEDKPFELDKYSTLIGYSVENNIKSYIDSIESSMVIIEFNNYKFGALITELYRSEVGNYFANKYIDSIDFVLIYDPFRKSFSLRSQKENINLNEITNFFSKTGGGHKKSAGFPLNKKNKWIINKIIKEQIKK